MHGRRLLVTGIAVMVRGPLVVVATVTCAAAACGGGGSSATAAPPPTATIVTTTLPPTTTTTLPPPPTTTTTTAPPITYVVQNGDTLYSIASRAGVTVQAIVQANSLTDASRIMIGQKLTLPPGASAPTGGR